MSVQTLLEYLLIPTYLEDSTPELVPQTSASHHPTSVINLLPSARQILSHYLQTGYQDSHPAKFIIHF